MTGLSSACSKVKVTSLSVLTTGCPSDVRINGYFVDV